jgi:hypothetical protein
METQYKLLDIVFKIIYNSIILKEYTSIAHNPEAKEKSENKYCVRELCG